MFIIDCKKSSTGPWNVLSCNRMSTALKVNRYKDMGILRIKVTDGITV